MTSIVFCPQFVPASLFLLSIRASHSHFLHIAYCWFNLAPLLIRALLRHFRSSSVRTTSFPSMTPRAFPFVPLAFPFPRSISLSTGWCLSNFRLTRLSLSSIRPRVCSLCLTLFLPSCAQRMLINLLSTVLVRLFNPFPVAMLFFYFSTLSISLNSSSPALFSNRKHVS